MTGSTSRNVCACPPEVKGVLGAQRTIAVAETVTRSAVAVHPVASHEGHILMEWLFSPFIRACQRLRLRRPRRREISLPLRRRAEACSPVNRVAADRFTGAGGSARSQTARRFSLPATREQAPAGGEELMLHPGRRLPRPRRRMRRGAFTLIELLVVISIIALLVGILVPSLERARELARRVVCSTRLRGIGVGLATYGEVYRAWPYVPLRGGSWAAPIGDRRAQSVFAPGLQNRNPSTTLYLLVRNSYCGAKMMTCPSSGDAESRQDDSRFYDFVDGGNLSFALMNPYGPERRFGPASGSAPILADASPYFDPKTGLRNEAKIADLASAPSQEEIRRGNSPNHAGQGQNVMVVGGSVRFESRADCGVENDNIYTRALSPYAVHPTGDIPTPGGDATEPDQGPAGPKDSYLIP